MFSCPGEEVPEPGMRRRALSSGLDARDQVTRAAEGSTENCEPRHDADIRGVFGVESQTAHPPTGERFLLSGFHLSLWRLTVHVTGPRGLRELPLHRATLSAPR